MIREIQTFEAVARGFLDESAPGVLANYSRQLQFIEREKPQGVSHWIISKDRPLKTAVSRGHYDRHGQLDVFATISTKWEIRCPAEKSKKKLPQKIFHLTGLASTTVKVFSKRDDDTEELLTAWQSDIGDADSPGCHFHIQVQHEDEQPPYPKTFPVPRFPSLLTSPLAAAEFVISELFQSEWIKSARPTSSDHIKWSAIQQNRMRNLLEWQRDIVADSIWSPWTFLKRAKPHSDIFGLN